MQFGSVMEYDNNQMLLSISGKRYTSMETSILGSSLCGKAREYDVISATRCGFELHLRHTDRRWKLHGTEIKTKHVIVAMFSESIMHYRSCRVLLMVCMQVWNLIMVRTHTKYCTSFHCKIINLRLKLESYASLGWCSGHCRNISMVFELPLAFNTIARSL